MTIHDLNKRFRSYFPFSVPLDMIMTMVKGPTHACIDIIKLDHELERHDREYNSDKCTYKDQQNVSMGLYIELKYGKEASDFIRSNMNEIANTDD